MLRDVPDLRDGQVRLALPAGFAYRSFQPSRRNVPTQLVLDDGSKLPGRHDGMAAFEGPGSLVTLVRNHEENGAELNGAFGVAGSPVYDSSALGGTSTVHLTLQGEVEHSFASLSGTQMNCSGGRMSWGSWITCEETVNGYDVGDDFTRPAGSDPLAQATNAKLQKTHGHIFEVPADGTATAEPITHAGRFAHESVAWEGGALYLSEDNFSFPSGFYKYVPPEDAEAVGRLLDGGRLYMLKVKGVTNADLARHLPDRTSFDVEWVEIDQRTQPRSPSVTHGREAVMAGIRAAHERGLVSRVTDGFATADRAALTVRCTYPTGEHVYCNALADVSDGKIVRWVGVQVWDE